MKMGTDTISSRRTQETGTDSLFHESAVMLLRRPLRRRFPRCAERAHGLDRGRADGGTTACIASRRTLLRAMAAGGAATLAASASGCGFQLRGSAQLPFRSIWLGFSALSPVGADLRRQIRASGAAVVDVPAQAEARLEVLHELREREILAFSSTGRPREYQLRLRVAFRVHDGKGRELIPATEIALRRDVSTNDLQVAARADEEALLYRDMSSDLVNQLLRRLSAIRA